MRMLGADAENRAHATFADNRQFYATNRILSGIIRYEIEYLNVRKHERTQYNAKSRPCKTDRRSR